MGAFKFFKELDLLQKKGESILDDTWKQINQTCDQVLEITNIYSFNIGKIFTILEQILRKYRLENAMDILPNIVKRLVNQIKSIHEKKNRIINARYLNILNTVNTEYEKSSDDQKYQFTGYINWIKQKIDSAPMDEKKEKVLTNYLIKSSKSQMQLENESTNPSEQNDTNTFSVEDLKKTVSFQNTPNEEPLLKKIHTAPSFHKTSKKLQQELGKAKNITTFTLTFSILKPFRCSYVSHIIGIHKKGNNLYYLYDSNLGTSTFTNIASLIKHLEKNYYKRLNPFTSYELKKYYPNMKGAEKHYKNHIQNNSEYWIQAITTTFTAASLILLIVSTNVALPVLTWIVLALFVAGEFTTIRNLILFIKKPIYDFLIYISKTISGGAKKENPATITRVQIEDISTMISNKYITKAHDDLDKFDQNIKNHTQQRTSQVSITTSSGIKTKPNIPVEILQTMNYVDKHAYNQILMFPQAGKGKCLGLTKLYAQKQHMQAKPAIYVAQ